MIFTYCIFTADDEGQQGEVNNISDKLENQNIIEGAEGETAGKYENSYSVATCI
jgi:hypothetical protein